MTLLESREWTDATAEDLVADALAADETTASVRMIVDWTEHGLLAPPVFRKSTRFGSDARLYSPEQRRLFHELLQMRQRSPLQRIPYRTLIRPVLYLWLIDDSVVPNVQARRAWRTWAQATGVANAVRRRQTARQLVDQFAHPDATYHLRRKAQLVIEECEKIRTPDFDKVYSVLTAVCSPWSVPAGQQIERGIGIPGAPIGVREAVALWALNWKVIRLLLHEQITEEQLAEGRAEFRNDWSNYQQHRALYQAHATDPELFTTPKDPEQNIKQQLHDFVLTLGGSLGIAEKIFTEARSASFT